MAGQDAKQGTYAINQLSKMDALSDLIQAVAGVAWQLEAFYLAEDEYPRASAYHNMHGALWDALKNMIGDPFQAEKFDVAAWFGESAEEDAKGYDGMAPTTKGR